jgi:actin-like ATPase involved in cell morphogenesis
MVCGADIGTMNVISSRKSNDGKVIFKRDRDVFIELPEEATDAKSFMDQAGAKLVTIDNKHYVVGEEAVNFASFLGQEFKRPLKSGLINPNEDELAIQMLDVIISSVLGEPKEQNEKCVFCVPAAPLDENRNVTYHQKTLEYIIQRHGYTPKAINEAQAIIYSELASNQLTGIALSFGAGMVNLCCTYRGFPVFSFSLARSGDWIDEQVKQATGKTSAEVTMIKETELDLSIDSENRVCRYLKNYYEELIDYVIRNIIKKFEATKTIPPILNAKNKLAESIPIVLAGGTSSCHGFAEMFRDRLEKSQFPFKISKIIVAQDPLYTVAKGLLNYSLA